MIRQQSLFISDLTLTYVTAKQPPEADAKSPAGKTKRNRGWDNLGPPWKPGQSGNPRGKPVGSRLKVQQRLDKLAHDEAEHLFDLQLQAARAGDILANRWILDKIWPAKKCNPTPRAIGPIKSAADALNVISQILAGQADGSLDLEASSKMLDSVKTAMVAIEGSELEQRVRALVTLLEKK
jgi:hypothetical protein